MSMVCTSHCNALWHKSWKMRLYCSADIFLLRVHPECTVLLNICIDIRWFPHFYTLSSFPPTLSSLIIILPPPFPQDSNVSCLFTGLSNPNLIRGTHTLPQKDEEWQGDGRVKEEWIAERKTMIERETGQARNTGEIKNKARQRQTVWVADKQEEHGEEGAQMVLSNDKQHIRQDRSISARGTSGFMEFPFEKAEKSVGVSVFRC